VTKKENNGCSSPKANNNCSKKKQQQSDQTKVIQLNKSNVIIAIVSLEYLDIYKIQ